MKKIIDYLEMLQKKPESKGLLFPTESPQNLNDAFAKALELTKEYQDLLILILNSSNRDKKINQKVPSPVLYAHLGTSEQREKLQKDLMDLVNH